LEGILALHDPRIMEMLDVKVILLSRTYYLKILIRPSQIFVEADMDVCLGRRSE
jgi:uridine kinase